MRITHQLIRSQAKESSLQSIQVLDLSGLDISVIERLSNCPKLQSLDLRNNSIESLSNNIASCPQLWSLNISRNKLRCLDGLGRFVAMGYLDLSRNRISWAELAKLQHLHILDLRLYGNPELERDPYYRVHVIDCLPHIWMLDGRLVTSAERLQVKSFFDDSALSERPVRHKLASKQFVPSTHKTREIDGIFGERAVHLMRNFPKQENNNVDLDCRRLNYLCEHIVYDIAPVTKDRQRVIDLDFLKNILDGSKTVQTIFIELIEMRQTDPQRSNMLIILLLASLHYNIPDKLLNETLDLMKLDSFGSVKSLDLFTLALEKKIFVMCILLNAVKIERIESKTGGLYDKLYLCMNYLLTESIKSSGRAAPTQTPPTNLFKQYKSLLAAEVVLLMCYVPSFSDYMRKDPGIMSLVMSATLDESIIAGATVLIQNLESEKVDEVELIKTVGQYIQAAVMINLSSQTGNHVAKAEDKIFLKKALPRRPSSGPVRSASYHTKGKPSPDTAPPRVSSAKPLRSKQPDVGEIVLVSPQAYAKIVSLPQPNMALVLLDMLPVNGAMTSRVENQEDKYAYIDCTEIMWDTGRSYWRPKGTIGSRVSVRHVNVEDIHIPETSRPNTVTVHPEIVKKEIEVNLPQPPPPMSGTGATSIISNSAADDLITIGPHPSAPNSSPHMVRSDRLKSAASNKVTPSPRKDQNNNNNNDSSTPMIEPHLINLSDGLSSNAIRSAQSTLPQRSQSKFDQTSNNHEQTAKHSETADDPDVESLDSGSLSEDADRIDRDYLIRQTLDSDPDDFVPNNSPGGPSRSSTKGANSRQPSAKIDAVYNMLRRQELGHQAGYNSRYSSQPTYREKYDDAEEYDVYNTTYMRQRAHEWNLKICGPDETPGVSVKWANMWLGGGKDLHREELSKRPKSAHVPGYKDKPNRDANNSRPHTTGSPIKPLKPSILRKTGSLRRTNSQGTYEQQVMLQTRLNSHNQTVGGYRSTYLKARRNMRNRPHMDTAQREMAWNDYINNIILAS